MAENPGPKGYMTIKLGWTPVDMTEATPGQTIDMPYGNDYNDIFVFQMPRRAKGSIRVFDYSADEHRDANP